MPEHNQVISPILSHHKRTDNLTVLPTLTQIGTVIRILTMNGTETTDVLGVDTR